MKMPKIKVRLFMAILAAGAVLALVVALNPASKDFAWAVWTGIVALYRGENE